MKGRIVFFVLGAALATIAYFAGDMNKAGAQDGTSIFRGTKVFQDDVVINGTLTVAGGTLSVSKNPFLSKKASDLESVITINANDEGGYIFIFNGPRDDNTREFPSRIIIRAETSDGDNISAINFDSDYGKDSFKISSKDKLKD